MDVNKNILNSDTSQSENAISTALSFIPRVYKRPKPKRVTFQVFSTRPFNFKGTEDELVQRVSTLNGVTARLYWYLTKMYSQGKCIYPSQAYLAQVFGCSPEWICKCLRRLYFLGLIDIYTRNHRVYIDGKPFIKNETNVYRVISDVIKRNVQERIMQYIPGFRFLFLAYLTVIPTLEAYPSWFFWANNGTWSAQVNRNLREQRDRYIDKAPRQFIQYNNGLFKVTSITTFDSNKTKQIVPKKKRVRMQAATNPKKGSYVSYNAKQSHVDPDKERILMLQRQLENVRSANSVDKQVKEQLKKIADEENSIEAAARWEMGLQVLREKGIM